MSSFRLGLKAFRRAAGREHAAVAERTPFYETVILGGGPAGTGSLIWAAGHGRLDAWLDSGVALVERSGELGGSLGAYPLTADSRASAAASAAAGTPGGIENWESDALPVM